MRNPRIGIRNSGPLYFLVVRDRLDYDGFCAATERGIAGRAAGIASEVDVHHEILHAAAAEHYLTCVPCDDHLGNIDRADKLDATYARLAIDIDAIQIDRLRATSEAMQRSRSRFMLEIVNELNRVPTIMRSLQDAGVEPDAWLVPSRSSMNAERLYLEIAEIARRDYRGYAGIVLRDSKEQEADSEKCLRLAAAAGFTGFMTTAHQRTPRGIADAYARRVEVFSNARA